MPNGNGLIEKARSQLNVKEQPLNSNSGPMVDTYLKAAGSAPGSPWCMAFVYWCSWQAGIPGLPKTASVEKFYQESLALGKIIAISDIAVGDIVLRVDYPVQANGQKPGDHAGIYTGIVDGVPQYISGNTVSSKDSKNDGTSSYVDEHQMKHFNYAARFW